MYFIEYEQRRISREKERVRRMNLTLNRQQTALIVALAILTLIILAFTLLSAVAHINVLHMILSSGVLPDGFTRWP